MEFVQRNSLKIFLTCPLLITYITDIYLIYGIFAYPVTILNFEKIAGRIFLKFYNMFVTYQ